MEIAQTLADLDLSRWIVPAAAVLGALIALWIAAGVYRTMRSRRRPARQVSSLEIQLDDLASDGPPVRGPTLLVHHVPVRLALVVLAPVGRGNELPQVAELPKLLDDAVPGLGRLLAPHGTRIKLWPPQ